MKEKRKSSRRKFLNQSLLLTSSLALSSFALKPEAKTTYLNEELFIIGPRKGYTPLIGTLVSMFENMSYQVKTTINNFTMEELDHQFDDNSNTIGALILHIISSEKFHQIGTLEERPLNYEELKFWGPARNLGDSSSKNIKGHDINYYLSIMDDVRRDTLAGLKQKDDEWLLSPDILLSTPEKSINKFWRLFHACEHMSNHNGQIKFLKSRLPSIQKN